MVSAIITVVIAVGTIGVLWVSLNLVADRARTSWTQFAALSAGIVAALFFGVLRGNRSIRPLIADPDFIELGAGGGLLGHFEWSIIGALLWAVGVFAMTTIPNRVVRIAIGVVVGVVTGWLIGRYVQLWHRPVLDIAPALVWSVVGGAVGAASRFRSKNWIPGVLIGAALGWTISVWLMANFGGTESDAVIAAAVPLALLGGRMGLGANPGIRELTVFDTRARAVIFLGPAISFLLMALVIPAIRTIWLSFLDRESENFVGIDNYRTLWRDEDSFNVSNWSAIFTSQLFWIAVLLVAAGVLVGFFTGQRRHGATTFERTGSSVGALALGAFIFAFAAFSVLRGTFFNNLWWVVTVTTVSTSLGLLIAVLAERAGRLESTAKAFIFMPMAVSFVGASIVWRLQYQARETSKSQTGVLNAVWVQLGRLSHSGFPRLLALVVLFGLLALMALRGYRRYNEGASFAPNVVGLIAVGYLFIELLRRSLGGFRFDSNGEVAPETVLFLQDQPFNNVFLMVVLIWIQTGFAMVILSAAIKSVPGEFTEAAKVDGASESQTFFHVVFPQILPTVGVVVTTLIVLVTKVFDIVKVTTGGNFGTNVLANDMYSVSFNFFNTGLGAAIATVILLSVMPVMALNVRRMQKERAA